MSGRARVIVPALLAVLVVVAGALLGGGLRLGGDPGTTAGNGPGTSGSGTTPATLFAPTPAPTPTERPPVGGTELYGYVPYWQMTDSMAAYLATNLVLALAMGFVNARVTRAPR